MKTYNLIPIALLALVSASYGFVSDPVLSPALGSLDAAFSLTMTCPSPGAVIHYTLNGTEPTLSDPTYVSGTPLTVARNWTVKAKAWVGVESSNTVSGTFQVSGSVAAGNAHSLALKGHGPVMAWGLRTSGRLGNNIVTSGNVLTPGASLYSAGSPITNGSLVATGAEHSVFLRNDGTVWDFGYNNKGQLGDNSTSDRALAVQVRKSTSTTDYLTGCVAVAAGTGFTIAANHPTGEVYAWGDQELGRLGNGNAGVGNRAYAGKVYQGTSGTTPLTGIKWVAAGGASALGLNPTTGKVWAWGQNSTGQLGQGTDSNNLPRAATVKQASGVDITDVTDIACGGDHSAFVRWKTGDPDLQGRVFCVGKQEFGRLGDNVVDNTNRRYADQPVLKAAGVPLEYIEQVAAGPGFTLALDTSGNVWSWGRNEKGALGTGNTADSALAIPVKKPDGTGQLGGIVRIAAGGIATATSPVVFQSFALAVAGDGKVYAWGHNGNGQLGNGSASTTTPVTLPVVVSGGLDLSTFPDVSLVCSVAPGANYSNAVELKIIPSTSSSTISTVDYMVDGVMKAQVSASPWVTTVTGLSSGSHHVYAMVTDSAGVKTQSPCADLTLSSDPEAENLDTDGDGVIDVTEVVLGTSTTDADTDGDGIPDGTDSMPLIPSTIPLSAAATLMVWSPLE